MVVLDSEPSKFALPYVKTIFVFSIMSISIEFRERDDSIAKRK